LSRELFFIQKNCLLYLDRNFLDFNRPFEHAIVIIISTMLTWSHYQFREHLKHKSQLMGNTNQVIVVTEEYTSKTCGQCGKIHWSLGSNKIFKCPSCKCTLGRDANGARNIFLKNEKHLLAAVMTTSQTANQEVMGPTPFIEFRRDQNE